MKKILIVDDATFMQKVSSGILSAKYETICASSGKEALELYERERPDLILSDLVMPGMTGLDLQSTLQARYGQVIPFMFMTADEREESESVGLEAGAMDYIRKPFKPEVLLRRVDNIMRHIESLEKIQGLKTETQTDPMTGLLNKAFVQKTLEEVCAKATGILMMVDLDSFKLVNDLYGHGMGDKILIRFAEILRAMIRTSDVAGRMGGDEFIVFCRDVLDEAVIAEKSRQINELLLASAKELMGPDMTIPLGASIGAVAVPEEGKEFAALYKKADKALYQVKQNGKHGCALFRGTAAEEAPAQKSSLDGVRMILEERNRQKGAYELGFESFRSVYRYLIRAIENYHRSMELVLFTVAGESGEIDLFGETLCQSLRRSDLVTKNGSNQFLVLLAEVDQESKDTALSRVLAHWAATGHGSRVKVGCESTTIQG